MASASASSIELVSEQPAFGGEIKEANQSGIRIILADLQAIYRVGTRKIFNIEDDLRIVDQADSLETLLAAVERHSADVVLLDGALLTSTPGAILELLSAAPEVKIIVQVEESVASRNLEFYRSGVRGVISRFISPDLLVRCVRCIAAGETWIDNQSVNCVIEDYRAQSVPGAKSHARTQLSPKEIAIVTCISQGLRNKEIASRVGTTEQVVKNYLRKIYDKLGVSDRLELALYCLHNKIT